MLDYYLVATALETGHALLMAALREKGRE